MPPGADNLAAAMDGEVRHFLDIVNELRRLGLQQDLPIPQIAVCGDQSTGKSSVLEAISGVPFPRGTDCVTKCATELSMTRGKTWSATVSVEDLGVKTTTERRDVGTFIEEFTAKLCADSTFCVDRTIRVRLEGPEYADLTLVDLPGIVRTATDGQSTDVVKQVSDLVNKYIAQGRTIILAVIPSNVDIATVDILERAAKVDPKGHRTVGVLTKPDLVDRGAEAGVCNVLANRTKPLRHGYFIVKNRGQADLTANMSIEEARQKEQEWFANSEFNAPEFESRVGVQALVRELSSLLAEHIKSTLPVLKKEVHTHLQADRANAEKLGKPPPATKGERLHQMTNVTRQWKEVMVATCSGSSGGGSRSIIRDGVANSSGQRLESVVRTEAVLREEFVHALRACKPDFDGRSDVYDVKVLKEGGIDHDFYVCEKQQKALFCCGGEHSSAFDEDDSALDEDDPEPDEVFQKWWITDLDEQFDAEKRDAKAYFVGGGSLTASYPSSKYRQRVKILSHVPLSKYHDQVKLVGHWRVGISLNFQTNDTNDSHTKLTVTGSASSEKARAVLQQLTGEYVRRKACLVCPGRDRSFALQSGELLTDVHLNVDNASVGTHVTMRSGAEVEVVKADRKFRESLAMEVEASRGREMPGFLNFEVFAAQVQQYVAKWIPCSKAFSDKVFDVVVAASERAIESLVTTAPHLAAAMTHKVRSEWGRAKQDLEERLRELIADESTPATQNHYFYDMLNKIRNERTRARVMKLPAAGGDKALVSREAVLQMLTSAVGGRSNKEQELDDMIAYLKAYWKVASKRFIDNVANRVHRVLTSNPAIHQVEQSLSQELLEAEDHVVLRWFSQSKHVESKRKMLANRIDRLTKAEAALQRV